MDDKREKIEEIDQKLHKEGWIFKGAILNYDKGWKNQGSVYEKDGKYIVSGLDFSGEHVLNEPISKEDAELRIKESMKEIRNFMFGQIQ